MKCSVVSTALVAGTALAAHHQIDRKRVVQTFNPRRNQSSTETPLQVGNGNFAFGVDVTGLQTFSPFNTLSTWGWHNFSLPTTPGQTEVSGKHIDRVYKRVRSTLTDMGRLSWNRLVDTWAARQLRHGQ